MASMETKTRLYGGLLMAATIRMLLLQATHRLLQLPPPTMRFHQGLRLALLPTDLTLPSDHRRRRLCH